MPNIIKNNSNFKNGDYKKTLCEAFHAIDGSGYEFSHADLKFNLPQQEDYFQDANYWGELAREIESNTQGPLKKQIMKLLGKEPAEVDLNTLEQKAGTEIRTEMDDAKVYSSTNMDRIDSDIGSDISLTDFIDSIPSWKSKVYNRNIYKLS